MFVIRTLNVLCTRWRQARAACIRYVCGKYEAERVQCRNGREQSDVKHCSALPVCRELNC